MTLELALAIIAKLSPIVIDAFNGTPPTAEQADFATKSREAAHDRLDAAVVKALLDAETPPTTGLSL